MKLDPSELRAAAEAHQARLASPLWANESPKGATWTAALSVGPVKGDPSPSMRQEAPSMAAAVPAPPSFPTEPTASAVSAHAEVGTREILPRLEAIDRAVERLASAVNRRPQRTDDVPAWLQTAAGDPHTYDAPDSDRTGVCVRILPTTYQRIQRAQRQMGLRTVAGAWEFLLRLGLATLTRLPAQ